MRLIDNNGKLSADKTVEIFISKQKLLHGANDNTLFVVDRVHQTARTLFIVDSLYQAGCMVEAVDRVLQLTVDTVCYNDYGIENRIIVIIM